MLAARSPCSGHSWRLPQPALSHPPVSSAKVAGSLAVERSMDFKVHIL
jgi:hypothetical protein